MKKSLIIIFSLAITISAIAQETTTFPEQETSKHEFSINAGGGMSTLLYSPAKGEQSIGFGYTFGLGYTFNFSENWAIITGLDIASYNSSYKANAPLSISYWITHPPVTPPPPAGSNATFFVTYRYTDYEESQSSIFLNIPIMLQYSIPVGNNKFYVAAGAKIGIPVSATFKIDGGQLNLTGYSYYTGQEYTHDHGFGQSSPSNDGDLDFKLSCMASLETGFCWTLSPQWNLYTGIYFDYGLTDISNTNENVMVEYNASGNHAYNSAIQSHPLNVDKINNMALGLKVRVSFR